MLFDHIIFPTIENKDEFGIRIFCFFFLQFFLFFFLNANS